MNKVDLLKEKLLSGANKQGLETTFFYLIKELGLSDHLLGKEFEGSFVWKGETVSFSFRQKPMSLSTFNVLVKELETHFEKERKSLNKRK